MKKASRVVAVALSLVGMAVCVLEAGACTAIVSGESTQCETDTDCHSKGGAFAVTVCKNNSCVGECLTTADCVKKDGYDPFFQSGTAAQTYAYLASASDGTDGGTGSINVPTSICVQNKCQPLRDRSNYCLDDPTNPLLFGDPNADNPVVIGLMADVSSLSTASISAPIEAFQQRYYSSAAGLVVDQFQNGLLSGASFSIEGRPLLLVCCRQNINDDVTTSTMGSAQHLLDLGAKAILGPQREDALPAAASVAFPAGVPIISPWALTQSESDIPGAPDLDFSTGINAADLLGPLNALLALEEAKIKAVKGAGYKIKVAAYFINVPGRFTSFSSFPDALSNGLQFNGNVAAVQNALDNSCHGAPGNTFCYKSFVNTQQSASITIADQLVAYQPDIILPFPNGEWSATYTIIEDAWPSNNPGVDLPIYVEPFLNGVDPTWAGPQATSNPASLQRYTGIRQARSAEYDTFETDFEQVNNGVPGYLEPGAPRAYESMLLAIYGAFAAARNADGGAFSGGDVATQIRQSIANASGQLSQATPDDFASAILTLNNQKAIQLHGLISNLIFNSTNHASVNWETWCVDPVTPTAPDYLSNRAYDPASGTFSAPSARCAPIDTSNGIGAEGDGGM